SIMQGLESSSATPNDGRSGNGSMRPSEELERPYVEELTPPPVEALTPPPAPAPMTYNGPDLFSTLSALNGGNMAPKRELVDVNGGMDELDSDVAEMIRQEAAAVRANKQQQPKQQQGNQNKRMRMEMSMSDDEDDEYHP